MNYMQIERLGEQLKRQHARVAALRKKYLEADEGSAEGTQILRARSRAVDKMRSIDSQYMCAVRSFCFIS